MIHCESKRKPTKFDLKPGMIVHTEDCSISLMLISDTPVNQDDRPMDWETGLLLDSYPAMVYARTPTGISTTSGYYTMLSSAYHLAEVQRLEHSGETA